MTTLDLYAQLAATLGASDFARPAVVTIGGVEHRTTAIGVDRDEIRTMDDGTEVVVGKARVWQVEVATLPSRPSERDRIAVGGETPKRIRSCVENASGLYEILVGAQAA